MDEMDGNAHGEIGQLYILIHVQNGQLYSYTCAKWTVTHMERKRMPSL